MRLIRTRRFDTVVCHAYSRVVRVSCARITAERRCRQAAATRAFVLSAHILYTKHTHAHTLTHSHTHEAHMRQFFAGA